MMPHPEDQKVGAPAEDLEGLEYEVGYKKPPLVSQFKKGQSGNPKGRPKGTKNLQTDLLEEFQESIQIHEGGRSTVISKQRALIKRLMEKALKGGERAAEILLKRAVAMGHDDEGSGSVADLSAEDEAILKLFRTPGSPEDSNSGPKKGP